MRFLRLLLFFLIIAIFCYFRLKPLYFQTVGYTYDQGRDFLKAAEIIFDRNITFIGPTTGILGLYHGVWWYYLLLIPFIIFKAAPIGFYYFNFLIQLISFVIFFYFLHKYFGTLITAIISFIVATSPYFVFTSIFVGNNIMVLPVLLLFLLINIHFIETDTKIPPLLLFIAGLLLGFITEFELAFGLFLIPSYIILMILYKKLRAMYFSTANLRMFMLGLFLPFIPRLLFEIKNNWMQTNTLLTQFFTRNQESPHLFSEAIQDRIQLFVSYYRGLFSPDYLILLVTFALVIFFFHYSGKGLLKFESPLHFLLSLISLLFLCSILLKDSFFWGNYFEGIQYLYLLVIAFVLTTNKSSILSAIKTALLIILIFTSFNSLVKDIKKVPDTNGTLKEHIQIVQHIQAQTKNNEYCVKIYTPPIFAHTYNYLFLYNNRVKDIPYPQQEWVKGKCWFIIEADDNKERQAKWLEDALPRKISELKNKKFNNTWVKLYKRN